MIFECFKIRPHSIQHSLPPLRNTPRNIPTWLIDSSFLPGTVGFQIRFRHHIDPFPIAQFIPRNLIGIMAGTHTVDMILMKTGQICQHILHTNYPTGMRIPFMTVYSLEDQTLSIQLHNTVFHHNPTKTNLIGYQLNQPSITGQQANLQMIQAGMAMLPYLYIWQQLRLHH